MKPAAYSFFLPLLTSATLFAGSDQASTDFDSKTQVEISTGEGLLPEWGVAMAVRSASLPFDSKDKSTTDVFPLFYYEGERFFLRGDNGGVKLWEGEKFGVNALARYRFFDIPEEYNQDVNGGTADLGVQAFWKLSDETQFQLEILSDIDGRMHSSVRWAGDYKRGDWRLFPEVELSFTGSDFNTEYYGIDKYGLGSGIEASASLKARRRLHKNLHLEAKVEAGLLGTEAYSSPIIEDDFRYEVYLGLGIFEGEPGAAEELEAKPYWRISQGWGTSSDFQNMIFGEHKTVDGADVRSTSIFYGHPLADSIFGVPIEMYITPGVMYHYSSDVQDTSLEFILAFKGYYTFKTPWRTRLGIAEGISFADSLTYYESEELIEKGHDESKLLNYLDLTVDLNLGDVFNKGKLEDLWLGTGIHHRSGIYGSSSAFGDVSGGTNFASIYLQWHGGF